MNWRYSQAGGRDLRLDFLRGYALFAMAVFHTAIQNSWFYTLSGKGAFYLNAPIGFFLISGLTLGRVARGRSAEASQKHLLSRTRDVFLAMLAIAYLGRWLEAATPLRIYFDQQLVVVRGQQLVNWLLQVPLLQANLHGSDVLAMYVFYNLLAILALVLLARGKGSWVVGALATGYAAYLLGGPAVRIINVFFNPLGFAPAYFGGLLLGWFWPDLSARWQALDSAKQAGLGWGLAALGLFFGLVHAWEYAWLPWLPGALGPRNELPPIRIALAALYLALFFWVLSQAWKPIHKLTGWFFIPLGQNSLWVFGAHLFLVDILMNTPWYQPGAAIAYGTAQQAVFLLAVWASVYVFRAVKGFIPKAVFWGAAIVLPLVLLVPYTQPPGYGEPYTPVVDNTNPNWAYSRAWEHSTTAALHGTCHMLSEQAGAGLVFWGSGVEIFGVVGPESGQALVWVDGQPVAVSPPPPPGKETRQQIAAVPGLATGEHHLLIRPLGAGSICLDAVIIYSRAK